MENKTFSVETKAGMFKSISFRTRWLLTDQNDEQFPMGDAVGHAECRGRVACGHAQCRGRVACGNPSKVAEQELSIIELSGFYKEKLEGLLNPNASVFELLQSKSKLLSD